MRGDCLCGDWGKLGQHWTALALLFFSCPFWRWEAHPRFFLGLDWLDTGPLRRREWADLITGGLGRCTSPASHEPQTSKRASPARPAASQYEKICLPAREHQRLSYLRHTTRPRICSGGKTGQARQDIHRGKNPRQQYEEKRTIPRHGKETETCKGGANPVCPQRHIKQCGDAKDALGTLSLSSRLSLWWTY